jgi:HAD superfamily hydrolase (TIGR01509 family)
MTLNNWKPRAVIFDMDGLLVDSETVWELAENDLLGVYGKHHDPVVRAQIVGLSTNDFLREMRRLYELPDSMETLRADVTRRMLALVPHKVKPRPGARELIEYVTTYKIPRAIASSSPLEVIDAIVVSQGWDDILQVRCSADQVERGKPAPDVYLRAAERLNLPPSDCLALEDSPTGARAAVAAGMVCYAVPDPSHTHVDAFEGITPYVFDSLHAVYAALR